MDSTAIERHQRYQSELRKNSSVVRFLLGRVALFMIGVVVVM
jgi:hypothetical protein